MLVGQQAKVVHSHLELSVGAENIYLQQKDNTSAAPPALTDQLEENV